MQLPQFIEDAGLDIDGVIWFRRNFDFYSSDSTFISLGPIDDSDVVYINGKQIGATEKDDARSRYYNIPKGLLKNKGNIIAVRVEDTGGRGGLHGTSDKLYIRSGIRKVPLSGVWKFDVETDYGQSAKNVFGSKSIADVFVRNYTNSGKNSKDVVAAVENNATIINIETIKNEMKYDLTEFTVKAGKPVELVLNNNDFMQHNLVIVDKGTKEKVGAAADRMAMDSNGAKQNFVPQIDEVLFATAMVNPDDKTTLRFTAPTEPGEYPFICTFPGHWQIMQGVMKVVAN